MEIEDNGSKLTLDQRVTALYEAGMTCAAQIHHRVSRKVDVTERTIQKKVNLLKEGKVLACKKKKVRSDKFLNEETAMEIEEYLEENPYANASEIISDLGYTIALRTMQAALKELGFHYLPVKKAPLINQAQKGSRVSFARENRRRDWDNVILADESSFQSFAAPKMAYQREGIDRLTRSVPKYPLKLHVWGGISLAGKTELFIFEENLDADLSRDFTRYPPA